MLRQTLDSRRTLDTRAKIALVALLLSIGLLASPRSVLQPSRAAASVPAITLYMNCFWDIPRHATGSIHVIGYNQNLSLSDHWFSEYYTWDGGYWWYATNRYVSVRTYDNGFTVGAENFWINNYSGGQSVPFRTRSC